MADLALVVSFKQGEIESTAESTYLLKIIMHLF